MRNKNGCQNGQATGTTKAVVCTRVTRMCERELCSTHSHSEKDDSGNEEAEGEVGLHERALAREYSRRKKDHEGKAAQQPAQKDEKVGAEVGMEEKAEEQSWGGGHCTTMYCPPPSCTHAHARTAGI